MKRTCCCCFHNSVRSLILLLSFFCIVSLFANVLLLNFAVIYNDDLLPRHFLPASTNGIATIPPIESAVNRTRREVKNETAIDEGAPIPDDVDSTSELISEIQKKDNIENIGESPEDEDQGHPVVDDSPEDTVTEATFPPIEVNTRRIILTRATPTPEEEPEKDANFDDSVTTAVPSAATKRHAKDPVVDDKDQEDLDNKEPVEKSPEDSENRDTSTADFSEFPFIDRPWSSEAMDWLFFAAPGIAMLIFHFPTSILLKKLGSHFIIFVCLLISGISTLVIPFVIEYGQLAIIITRFIQGLAFAPVFSFIGQNAVNWGTLKEQLWFLCTSISSFILAPVISWSLSNEILKSENFNFVFYFHGFISLFLGIIWLIFYRNTPQKHRWINGLELNKIVTGKALNNRVMERNSLSLVFKSISAITIWISGYSYFFAFLFFSIFFPIYATKVLNVNLYSNILFILLPFILMALIHWINFLINKIMNSCGLTKKVRIFNSITLFGTSICFLGLAISTAFHGNEDYSLINMIIHFLILIPLGFAINGFFQSSIVVGRFYSQFIIGNLQLAFSLAFIFVPATVIFWTPLNLLRYWRVVFLVIASILIFASVMFCFFGRGQPEHWAENSWDPTATHRMLQPVRMSSDGECGIMEMRTVSHYPKSMED